MSGQWVQINGVHFCSRSHLQQHENRLIWTFLYKGLPSFPVMNLCVVLKWQSGVFIFKADSSLIAAKALNAPSPPATPADNLHSPMLILNKCQLLSAVCLLKPGPVRSPLNPPLEVMKLWVETNLHKYVTCSIILSCVYEMKRVRLCFWMIGLINMCLVQTIVEK